MADSPRMIILAGANGSGKTTVARTLLAETLGVMTYVNADVIAQGLSGFEPGAAAIQAGRIMLERLHDLAARRADFAFETTLAGRTYATWLPTLRAAGYYIRLLFIWLPSPDLNVARVALRVKAGGHDVPEATIRQRYGRGIANFLSTYRNLVDEWQVYHNSRRDQLQLIAEGEAGGERIHDAVLWGQFLGGAKHE